VGIRHRVERARSSLADIWSDHPSADYGIVAAFVGLHVGVIVRFRRGDLLVWISPDRRIALYTTLAAVVAIVFGFCTAAVSYYLGSRGERMMRLRRRAGAAFRRNWRSVLSTQLTAAGTSLALLIVDDSRSVASWGVRWLTEVTLLITAARSGRLIWLFSQMLDIADVEDTAPTLAPAPGIAFKPHPPARTGQ